MKSGILRRINMKSRIALALLCLAPTALTAQTPGAATLTGKVVDEQNKALKDALVQVKTGGGLLASARAPNGGTARLTGRLKTEPGFDGYLISDRQGIADSNQPGFTSPDGYGPSANPGPSLTKDAARKAINAGIDLAIEPGGPRAECRSSCSQATHFLVAWLSGAGGGGVADIL
jgi:hypothetical protein